MTSIRLMSVKERAAKARFILIVTAVRKWVTDHNGVNVSPVGVRTGPGCAHRVWHEFKVVSATPRPGMAATSVPPPGTTFVFEAWTMGINTLTAAATHVADPNEQWVFFATTLDHTPLPQAGLAAPVNVATSAQQACPVAATSEHAEAVASMTEAAAAAAAQPKRPHPKPAVKGVPAPREARTRAAAAAPARR